MIQKSHRTPITAGSSFMEREKLLATDESEQPSAW